MRFGILGPLAVTTDDGEPVTVPGTKVRLLLSILLASRNRVVSADRLVEDLWGADAPANPLGALQVRVSQLRKALNDAEPGARDLVESRPPGYVLRAGDVDADRFGVLAGSTDAGRLAEALSLWRGEAYADVADEDFARAETMRLAEQRLVVHERLAEARLARGEHDLVAAELAGLVERHPLREGLRALHLRALYASGRQTEALDSYADLRERLAEELGLDPGPELAALYKRILDQDAGLSAPPKAALIRNSLPARMDDLVGRAEALTELRGLLPKARLVTLVGPGGVGKTRLATETAHEQDFPDGAHLVELAPLPAGSGEIAERVLAALDAREVTGASVAAADRLTAVLRHREALLVLDNCEHVIDAAAALVARLLREAPGLTVLATSREPLGVTGEMVWEVPPLALPALDDADAVHRSPAARLFAVRAAARQRGFLLDASTAPLVARLVRRLDGLPLALELAATRVRALGLKGVVDRLDDRFTLLTTRQRDLPDRQRTLAELIGWSWDLLDEEERRVLATLSVFGGGCDLDAAEEICASGLDVLDRLVDRSLVVLDETPAGPRYRLLESVAAFGAERLTDATAAARHAAYYSALAERADAGLRGPEQRAWLARLDAEAENLRAALDREGLRPALALSWYWFLRGRLSEARRRLAVTGSPRDEELAAPWRLGFALLQGEPLDAGAARAAVAGAPNGRAAWFAARAVLDAGNVALATELLPAEPDGDWTEAAVLSTRAMLAHAEGNLPEMEAVATRAERLFTAEGDAWGRLQAGEWLAALADLGGDYPRAIAVHEEGLRLAEELSLWPDVGGKLSWLAWLATQSGDQDRARELGGRALAMAREHGSPAAAVFAELSLGFAERRGGDLDAAEARLGRLAEGGRVDGVPSLYLPMVLVELGYAAGERGDRAGALALHRDAFDAALEIGAGQDTMGALEGLASLVDSPELAARLLGAAAAGRAASGVVASPAERPGIELATARVTGALGAERVGELLAEGATMGPERVRALI
ncbi:SARP family transcriptional regulator [Actinorhabdospora filicis]|uniref:SARP family transcriptional regulator n=1 Tax=Actinorhabdospora filicis TaxID=1785913 RepID=A0A9W6W9A6_9ACTN|nr:BTAD domain-containing putative transcriptional regulator [Actinorhabdospora filicis]GLZ77798.1 SARP family transcriptional regulator [Actinorhabdospora filicis]